MFKRADTGGYEQTTSSRGAGTNAPIEFPRQWKTPGPQITPPGSPGRDSQSRPLSPPKSPPGQAKKLPRSPPQFAVARPRERGVSLRERALDIFLQHSCTASASFCPQATSAVPLVSKYLSGEVRKFPWYRAMLAHSCQKARDYTAGFWLHTGEGGFPNMDWAHCETLREACELAQVTGWSYLDISAGDYSLYSHAANLFERDEMDVGTMSVSVKSPIKITGRGKVTLRGQVVMDKGSSGSILKNLIIDSNLNRAGGNPGGDLQRETSSVSTLNLGSENAVLIIDGNVRLEECEILSGMHGIEARATGTQPDEKTILLNNHVHHCAGSGVYVHGDSCAIMVNCACSNNNRNGACVSGAEAVLKGNRFLIQSASENNNFEPRYRNSFKGNEHFGVRCDEGGACHLKNSEFEDNNLGEIHVGHAQHNAPWMPAGAAQVVDELPAMVFFPEFDDIGGEEFAGLIAAAAEQTSTPQDTTPEPTHEITLDEDQFFMLRDNFMSPSPSIARDHSPNSDTSDYDDIGIVDDISLPDSAINRIPSPASNSHNSYHADRSSSSRGV